MNKGGGRTRRPARLAVLPAVLALSACLPTFEQPDVRLDGVRLGALGFRGGTLNARVLVTNPNRFALRSASMSYELEINDPSEPGTDQWLPIADGLLDREVTVPAGDSAVVEVPVEFTWTGVGNAIRAALDSGVLDYRLTGDLDVTAPLRRRVPFRRTGSIDLVGRQ